MMHSSHTMSRAHTRIALITGVARNADSTRHILELCCRAKSEGKVDRIVVSTWHTDIPNWQSLGFGGCGIEVIADNEPPTKTWGHIIHQMKSLSNGLSIMGDEDVCVKFRSDRCVPEISQGLINCAQKDLEEPDLSLGFPGVFSKRIRAPYANPNYPFLIHDIEYLGLCKDLKKLVHFDMSFYDVMCVASPEAFMHSRPFFDLFPEVRVSHQIRIWRLMHNDELTLLLNAVRWTPTLQLILAAYWAIVSRYYSIGWGGRPNRVAANRFDLFTALLDGDPRLGINKHLKYAGSVCCTDYLFRGAAGHSPVLFPTLAEYGYSWRSAPYSFFQSPPIAFDTDGSRRVVDAIADYETFPKEPFPISRGHAIERGVL